MTLINTAQTILAQASPAEGNPIMSIAPILLMFVVLYFLMIRPQMKRQKEARKMLEALSKGDEVVAAGGLLGKVVEVNDSYTTLEVAQLADKPVEVRVQKSAVTALLPKGTIKSL